MLLLHEVGWRCEVDLPGTIAYPWPEFDQS